MRIFYRMMFLFLLAIPLGAQELKPTVGSLKWLTGCWQTKDNGKITTERWLKPTSNLMIGISHTVKDGRSVAFEFLRIVDNGHGVIYVAKPSNTQAETGFFVKTASSAEVIFENPKHDFPQRIIYRLVNKNSLLARIEGKNKERETGIDFPMKRVQCE